MTLDRDKAAHVGSEEGRLVALENQGTHRGKER
jgi:hypothetical protein